MEEKEVLLKINPKFNIIYELGMPTGKKIKVCIIAILILIIFFVVGNILSGYIRFNDSNEKASTVNIMNIIFGTLTVFFIIKLIIHIVIQNLQYKNITYTFYKDTMEYKDTFWNQQTKVIRYENIKEIEVRKNIWERINKCGIIILYTNAEKNKNKGMIIYSIQNVDEIYKKIENIINIKNDNISSEKNKEIK